MNPNLSQIPPSMQKAAIQAFNDGKADELMMLLDSHQRGEFLFGNLEVLKARGMFEAALFETYVHGPHYAPDVWRLLFNEADRAKLASFGDPLPTSAITLFRGVRCRRHRKFIRALSWTTDKHMAAWFATRFATKDDDPAVYSLKVSPSHIFLMTNDRSEREAVIASWECGRLRRLPVIP
jgi:hypothetical protein